MKFIERLKILVDNTPPCVENDNGIDNALVDVENVNDITVRDFIKVKLLWMKESQKNLVKKKKFKDLGESLHYLSTSKAYGVVIEGCKILTFHIMSNNLNRINYFISS